MTALSTPANKYNATNSCSVERVGLEHNTNKSRNGQLLEYFGVLEGGVAVVEGPL